MIIMGISMVALTGLIILVVKGFIRIDNEMNIPCTECGVKRDHKDTCYYYKEPESYNWD